MLPFILKKKYVLVSTASKKPCVPVRWRKSYYGCNTCNIFAYVETLEYVLLTPTGAALLKLVYMRRSLAVPTYTVVRKMRVLRLLFWRHGNVFTTSILLKWFLLAAVVRDFRELGTFLLRTAGCNSSCRRKSELVVVKRTKTRKLTTDIWHFCL